MKAPQFEKQQHGENTEQVCQRGWVCSGSRERHTVAPAFRHTLYLLNIWTAHGSLLREVDQPAALSGPENIDCQHKENEGFKDSNILQEPYVLLSSHPLFNLMFSSSLSSLISLHLPRAQLCQPATLVLSTYPSPYVSLFSWLWSERKTLLYQSQTSGDSDTLYLLIQPLLQ